jgi:hypothetical protein
VTASDVEPDALPYVRASARRTLGRAIATTVLDLRAPPSKRFDVVLAADVLLYEPGNAGVLVSTTRR